MANPIPDLPEEIGDHDCPICYEPNTLQGRDPICPNGHTYCADCQPRIQSVRTGWGLGQRGIACCPLCRASIPYVPLLPPPGALLANGQPDPFFAPPPPRAPAPAPAPPQDGRANDPDRRQRAIDGFNDLPARRRAQALFREARNNGTIPQNAAFGGIHRRNCPCGRRHGANGVRFLKMPDNRRLYRCEACYIAAYAQAGMNVIPPPPPEWSMNGIALAAHNDQDV